MASVNVLSTYDIAGRNWVVWHAACPSNPWSRHPVKVGRVKCSGGTLSTKKRTWFSLLMFCLTAALASALAAAVLFAGASFVFAKSQSAAGDAAATLAPQSLSGVISDSRCGARHMPNSGKSPAECTRFCVRQGASYVLVNGDQIYVLRGRPSTIERLAGQRVVVTGALDGNTLRVKSVVAQ